MATSSLLALALGGNSNETRIQSVWNKGRIIPGYDGREWRRDDDGNIIRRSDYGKKDSPHGWEIDHITATAIGGLDVYGNLRPLHCRGNSLRGGILSQLLGK